MARSPDNLPEGTNSIIPGASAGDFDNRDESYGMDRERADPYTPSTGSAGVTAGTAAQAATSLKEEAKQVVSDKTAGLRDQATDTVRSYALQGKDKATDALDNVIRMIDDAAATVDEKIGSQYGSYVRQAGEALAGVSTTLREKDVDDLVDDARGVVRSSPALAIGAAAAVGFLVARIVKAGATPSTTTVADDTNPTTTSTPRSAA
jgi:ElaB/YqjD/DUF883 family membrane-anchored ribosome-binding protein